MIREEAMQRRKMPGWMVVLFAFALVVAGCAETELIIHSAKRVITAVEEPPEIKYKVGNPYQIRGVWYYPNEDYQYDETGIASWYGAQFHDRHTANGEVYNMNALTAAHRTLPLPSFVRVTNLENGRSLILRVNDRGPFARGRIIDISRRGAQLLGFQKQGTAKVRVQIIADRSRALAAQLRNQAQLAKVGTPITVDRLPKPIVKAEALQPPLGANSSTVAALTPAKAEPMASMLVTEPELNKLLNTRPVEDEVLIVPVSKTKIFIQAGAFGIYENANKVKSRLTPIGLVKLTSVLINGKDLFRVRVGPLASVNEADRMLETVARAGYPKARIIVE